MWMSVAQFGARPIRTLAMIFLARLLDPQDFGLVALALLLITATDLFSGLGMDNAVIHSQEEPRTIAFQAFATTALFSIFLFLIVFTQASFFAQLLGDPAVAPILQWLSVVIVLESLFLVPNALLRKELMFRQVSMARLTQSLVYNATAVGFALAGFGLWSLVYGELAGSLAKLLVVTLAYPGFDWLLPKRPNWKALKGLLGYGIQSTGSGMLTYLNTNWDDWLVGRVLGTTSLGFYSKAYNLTNKGIVNFSRSVIGGVFFPSFAKIQDDKERLTRAYLKSLGMVALIMTPVSIGVLVIAPEMVPILLGDKWLPMVLSLQIFAFMGLVRPLAASTSPLFLAVGRPDLNVRVALLLLIVMVAMVLPLLSRGIEGVALAVVVSYTIAFFYSVFEVNRLLPGIAKKMARVILPALLAAAIMVVGVQLSKGPLLRLAGGTHNLITLGIMIVIGAVLYISISLLTQRALILETVSVAIAVFKDRKKKSLQKPLREGT